MAYNFILHTVYLAVLVIFSLVAYAAFGFMFWTLDPYAWGGLARFAFVCVILFNMAAAAALSPVITDNIAGKD